MEDNKNRNSVALGVFLLATHSSMDQGVLTSFYGLSTRTIKSKTDQKVPGSTSIPRNEPSCRREKVR